MIAARLIPNTTSKRICDQLERQCGLERRQIMIACSHTHSGPVLECADPGCYPLDDEQLASVRLVVEPDDLRGEHRRVWVKTKQSKRQHRKRRRR